MTVSARVHPGREQERRASAPPAASRTATLREIAGLAGTSKSTVSRVLTNDPRISPRTRKRVQRVIRQQGYRPNVFARALAGGRTGHIGVLSMHIDPFFFAGVIRGVDLAAQEFDQHLVCSFAHGHEDYLRLYDRMSGEGQIDGLLLIAPPEQLYLRPAPARIPAVLCASRPRDGRREWKECDAVALDNRTAMREIVRRLAESGSRRLLHLAGWSLNSDARERRAAFEEAVAADPRLRGEVIEAGMIREDATQALKKLLRRRRSLPDTLVCFNDSLALGALDLLKGASARQPAIRMTGWDNGPAAQLLNFTSVEIPTETLGKESGRLLLERTNRANRAPPSILELPLTLHWREPER